MEEKSNGYLICQNLIEGLESSSSCVRVVQLSTSIAPVLEQKQLM